MKVTRMLAGAGALAALIATAGIAMQVERASPARGAEIVVTELPGDPARVALPTVERLFDGYVRDGKMPGIVGAFGFGDAPTLFLGSGRIATDAAAPFADADSLWRVYSMTKPVTATAAMILIQEGRIGLDDPVAKYIPAFATMRVLTSPDTSLESVPATRPITIRELLTHSAGLSYNINAKGPLLKLYEARGILPAQVNAAMETRMRMVRPRTLAEFADRVAALPLIAQPGTKWHYSIGLDVMGRVIEVASGMPFDTFVNTRIFAPLGMRSSFWTVPQLEVKRLATEYTFVADRMVPFDTPATSPYLTAPSFPYGGAGLVMSARDYDRFLHMLQNYGSLDGATVLKPDTARLMMSNLLPAGVTFPGIGNVNGNGVTQVAAAAKIGFGAGGSVYLSDGPGGFPSKGTYGWGGAAGTIAFVDPARRTRGTIMVNYFPGEQWPLRTEAVGALARDALAMRRR